MKTHPVIVSRKVDDLIPYARNSRTHSDAQVAQIAASVREFGWTNPVLVDGENGIIAGHHRAVPGRPGRQYARRYAPDRRPYRGGA